MQATQRLGILALFIVLVFTFSPARAANCDGLQLTGDIPAGTYILTDNCVTTGTLNVTAGTVTINGNGFAIDGNTTHGVFDVSAGATLNLNNVTVRNGNNPMLMGGGGIDNDGTVSLTNVTITNNSATEGSGITNSGILTVVNSTISNNPGAGGFGGGIRNVGGTVTIVNSTILGNSQPGGGGGGISNSAGIVTITNSTISDNSALGGGGIFVFNGGTVTITNSTISGNSANGSYGGGIDNDGGAIAITNTILSANTSPLGNCNGTVNDNGGNIENTDTCGFGTGANINPLLGAFNGSYYPLLAGSPAIDSAPTCAGLTNDQIGTSRPQGVACDIGAIEMPQTAVTNPTTGQPTFELVTIVNPAVPSLNEWNATASENRAEAYGVQDNVYATIHMQNGAWQYNSGGIPQDLIDYGVIMAIDVWEQGGDQYFDHYEKVCLLGEGRLIYFDATQSPRPMVEITPVTLEDGYTCGWIPNAGTLVLIRPE